MNTIDPFIMRELDKLDGTLLPDIVDLEVGRYSKRLFLTDKGIKILQGSVGFIDSDSPNFALNEDCFLLESCDEPIIKPCLVWKRSAA